MNRTAARSVTVIPPTINPLTHLSKVTIQKRRVAGYARVSTDSDEQFTSYEAQVDYYTQYIKRNPEWEFVKVYTDEGISGTNTKHRIGFNEMIADAMSGKIDLIVTKSVSRFARNTRDLLDLVERLTEKQVEFVSRKEAIDTTTPTGKFMLTVFAAVAELEREYILQRQREGIAIAQEQGKYTGRKPMPLPDNFERVVARWRAGEITAAEAMRQTGLKPNTFYRRCSQTSLALKRIKSI